MVAWKYFSKRRNITLQSLSDLSYKEYHAWCTVRGVLPLSKTEWPYTDGHITEEVQEPDLPNWTYKSLNKKKKSVLSNLAKKHHVNLDGTETKKIIINLLLGLNN